MSSRRSNVRSSEDVLDKNLTESMSSKLVQKNGIGKKSKRKERSVYLSIWYKKSVIETSCIFKISASPRHFSNCQTLLSSFFRHVPHLQQLMNDHEHKETANSNKSSKRMAMRKQATIRPENDDDLETDDDDDSGTLMTNSTSSCSKSRSSKSGEEKMIVKNQRKVQKERRPKSKSSSLNGVVLGKKLESVFLNI